MDFSDESQAPPAKTRRISYHGAPRSSLDAATRSCEDGGAAQDEQSSDFDLSSLKTNASSTSTKPSREFGIIDTLELKDFMCHRHHRIKFGPRVNFLCGRNGSGKSAILSALILGLGGRPSVTQRGNSTRCFIREGASQSTITLTLNNCGEDPYQPQVYGHKIVIVRRFAAEGQQASSYQVKSSNLKTITTRKRDLDALLDHFGIQVDNPLNVLNQDKARQFLNCSTDSDRYRMFLDGTQIGRLREDHDETRVNMSEMDRRLNKARSRVSTLLKDMQDAEKVVEAVKMVGKTQEELSRIECMIMWARVERQEEVIKAMRDSVPNIEEVITELRQEVLNSQDKIEELVNRAAAKKAEIDSAISQNEEIGKLTAQVNDLGFELEIKRSDIEDVKIEMSRIQKEHNISQANVAAIRKKIDQAREAKGITKNPQDEMQKLQEEEFSLKSDFRQRRQRLEEIAEERTRLRSQREAIEKTKSVREKAISESKHEITALQKNGNRIQTFGGRRMVHLVEELERQRSKFRAPPVGPLGLYISMRQEHQAFEWAAYNVVGRVLSDFLVVCREDCERLNRIKRRLGVGGQVFVEQEDRFDYSSGEPDPVYVTLLRALSFSHDRVKRLLINQVKIEGVMLVNNRHEGEQIFAHFGNRLPPKVVACYTKEGHKIGMLSRGRAIFAAPRDNRDRIRIGANVSEAIQMYKQSIEKNQHAISEMKAEFDDIVSSDRVLRTERDDCNKLITQDSRRLQEINQELRQLQVDLENLNNVMKDDDLVKLESERVQLEDIMRAQTESYQLANERKEEIEKEREAMARQKNGVTSQITALREKSEIRHRELAEIEAAIGNARGERKYWDDQMAKKQLDLSNRREVIQSEEGTLATRVAEAESVGARLAVTMDKESLSRERQKLQKVLEKRERSVGMSEEEALTTLAEKTKRYHENNAEIAKSIAFLEKLAHQLEERLRRVQRFRKDIAHRARMHFTYLLHCRGYDGRIKFDHKKETLEISVDTSRNHAVQGEGPAEVSRSVRTLSGGEKSFSTLCLLLSLWEAMHCPIRSLDEFDVFMDSVNRRIGMRMICETANENSGVQYLLITPQGMQHLGDSTLRRGVKFIRLDDPERNQRTLDEFGAVG